MANNSNSNSYDSSWYKRQSPSGIRVADTLDEIKEFAFSTFDSLDKDKNGFISKVELQEALISKTYDWRQRSYISFLLRRIEDIADSYDEEWTSEKEGISRTDIQEYFKGVRENQFQ